MKLRFSIAVIITLTWLLGWLPVSAQNSDSPVIKAVAGYQGNFKYGEWLPVWIELENQGKDIEGEVRIQVSGSLGVTVFAAPVSLPSGSRKQFPLYILPNNFSRELQVDLVSKNKTIASQKFSVKPQANISFFVGLISPERGALTLLNGVTLPGQDRPKVITDLSLSDIPDRPEALRSFDVLILNNIDTSQITPEQVRALEGWVQSGGRLVIGGGAGGMQTAARLSEVLLPGRVQNMYEIGADQVQDLARFSGSQEKIIGQSLVASSIVPVESHILSGSQDRPWVVERPVGQGHVDWVAFDLSGVPFNGWPGTQAFWESLIGPGSAYPENMPFDMSIRQMRGNQLSYALSNIPALDLPSIQGLSILLGIYILVVGPVNYLVLRRLHRLQLAWVTIPAITVLFTAGAFGIGYALRGTDLIMNKIALVEVQPSGSASVTSYLGLFSPRQQSYEIQVNSQGLLSPMSTYDTGMWGSSGTSTTGGEMTFVQGSPSIIKGLTVNQFAMQSFMAEEIWENFGQISGDLYMEGDVLKGTVRNGTNYKLTDVVLVIQNRFARLGDMEPGQEARIDLGLGSLQTDRFGPAISYTIFQDRMNQSGPNTREIDLKVNILSSILDNNTYWSKLSSMPVPGSGPAATLTNNPVFVFGWLNQAPPDVAVQNNRLAQQATALVYTTMNYKLPENGPVNLPVGMIPGSLSKAPRDGGICGPAGMASVSMGAGEAEFTFQIPPEITGAQLNALKVNLWRDSGGDWGLPEIALWDWQAENWLSIQTPIIGINVIKDPAALVNGYGSIRLRLKSDSNMYACYYLDLGLEAERVKESGGLP